MSPPSSGVGGAAGGGGSHNRGRQASGQGQGGGGHAGQPRGGGNRWRSAASRQTGQQASSRRRPAGGDNSNRDRGPAHSSSSRRRAATSSPPSATPTLMSLPTPPTLRDMRNWPQLTSPEVKVNSRSSDGTESAGRGGGSANSDKGSMSASPGDGGCVDTDSGISSSFAAAVAAEPRSGVKSSPGPSLRPCDPPARPHLPLPPQHQCRTNRETMVMMESPNFVRLCRRFNWRVAAAKYLFRTQTMEDYLAVYIHALATYRAPGRGADAESVEELAQRLIVLSESCPEDDVLHIMAPSISGVVYNQTAGNGSSFSHPKASGNVAQSRGCPSGGGDRRQQQSQRRSFDVGAILERRPDLFELQQHRGGRRVRYLWRREDVQAPSWREVRAEAADRLRFILVEGIFIYFFAKFCHGPYFEIKVSFYHRSEPVRSVLQLVTGRADVEDALLAFFKTFNEIFVFDRESYRLSLDVDYFHKTKRETMRKYLTDGESDAAGDGKERVISLRSSNNNSNHNGRAYRGDEENGYTNNSSRRRRSSATAARVGRPPHRSPPAAAVAAAAPRHRTRRRHDSLEACRSCDSDEVEDDDYDGDEDEDGGSRAEEEAEGTAAYYYGGEEEDDGCFSNGRASSLAAPSVASSGGQHAALLDCLLAPAGLAQTKSLARLGGGLSSPHDPRLPWPQCGPPGESADVLPSSVQSVLETVLLDGEEDGEQLGLLTNPLAVDHVINKIEGQGRGLTVDPRRRALFKTQIEEETRRILAAMLDECGGSGGDHMATAAAAVDDRGGPGFGHSNGRMF